MSWSPYFHYGMFSTEKDPLYAAQENAIDYWCQLTQATDSSKILDVGHGIGSTGVYIAEKLNSRIWGIDPVKEQVDFANARALKKNLNHLLQFRQAKAEEIDFEESSFDIVFCNEVLCHVNNVDTALQEIKRVLRPKGKFLLTDLISNTEYPLKHAQFFIDYTKQVKLFETLVNYQKRLENNGFKIEQTQQYDLNFQRSYESALAQINRNKEVIIKQFGADQFEQAKNFYQQCLNDQFLSEVSWGLLLASI